MNTSQEANLEDGISKAAVRILIEKEVARAGSIRKLATKWGIPTSTLGKFLVTEREPTPPMLEKLGLTKRVREDFVLKKSP